MSYHPVRIDRLDRGSVFLIISEGQPADEYTVPVGFGHHVAGSTRWTIQVRIPTLDRGERTYETDRQVAPSWSQGGDIQDWTMTSGSYFRSWEDVVQFADRCLGGHAYYLAQPNPNDIVRWARQAEHDTVIRYDGLAVASEAIRKRRGEG